MDRPTNRAGSDAWRGAVATPAFVVGGAAFLVFGVFAANDSGFSPTVWYPAALFLLGLLAVTVAIFRPISFRIPVAAALAFLAAFTLWSYASIAWSRDEGAAWDGSNKTLLYLITYALVVIVPWTTRTAVLLLGGHALGVAALGFATLVAADRAADPGDFFIRGRLSEPIGYQNGACALFMGAFWIVLFLATRHELPPLVRGVGHAAAAILAELALMTQSRGAVAAVPLCLALYLVIVSGRLRALVSLALVGSAVALSTPTLLEVFPAFREGRPEPAVHDAFLAVVLSAVGVGLAGWLFARAQRRFPLSPRLTHAAGRIAAGAAAVLVCAAIIVLALSGPVDHVQRAWDDFKGDESSAASSNFAAGFTTNRYDIWRVAWREFLDSPAQGIGADNFAIEYILERRSSEEVLSPHSLELRMLAQLGLVGGALFVAFLAFAVAAGVRRAIQEPLAATLLVVFAYWAVHGSIDWFWDLPALTCPAFAAVAVSARVGRNVTERRVVTAGRRAPLLVVGGVAALAAAGSLTFPWLAQKEMQQAAGTWRTDPAEAFARLERARTLNPLTDQPDALAGAIASRVNDPARMQQAFESALVRNPYNWYAKFELGLLAASQGRRQVALQRLEEARRLNPREPAIGLVANQVRGGEKVVRAEYDRLFFARAESVVD